MCGSNVRTISTSTGEAGRSLHGHAAAVTGLAVSPGNAAAMLTVSLDGTLRVWDYEDATEVQKIDLGAPAVRLAVSDSEPDAAYVALLSGGRGAAANSSVGGAGGLASAGHAAGNDHSDLALNGGVIVGEEVVSAISSRRGAAPAHKVRLVRLDLSTGVVDRVIAKKEGVCTGLVARPREPLRHVGGTGAGSSGGAAGSVVLGGGGAVLASSGASQSASAKLLAANAAAAADADGEDTHGGGSIVCCTIKRTLFVWDSATGALRKFPHVVHLTAVAVHPRDPYVITGDADGKIKFWYCLDASEAAADSSEVTTTTQHWHANAVASVAFTPDGAYLLSGGQEGVLVVWQLATGTKTFLPRLGAPLRSIGVSDSQEWYAVGLASNGISFVNALSSRVAFVYRGLELASHGSSERVLAGGLVPDPRTGAVAINGAPSGGAVQLYDAVRDRHIATLQVAPRNFVSGADAKPPPPVRVYCAAFSPDGSVVATIDRCDDEMLDTLSLKFWDWVPEQGRYVLNSRVEAPHKTTVSALRYHPTMHVIVSTSHDRTFKVWERHQREQDPSMADAAAAARGKGRGARRRARNAAARSSVRQTSWRCRSVGFYRDFPLNDGAFSSDGSLLAVACAHVLTLWSPMSTTLLRTLTHPGPTEPVRRCAFVPESEYLIAATDTQLYVWNTLSCTVWWSYRAAVRSLAVDTFAFGGRPATFAVAVHVGDDDAPRSKRATKSRRVASEPGTHICLFSPVSSTPLRVWSLGDAERSSALAFVAHRALDSEKVALKDDEDLEAEDGDDEGAPSKSVASEADAAARLVCLSDSHKILRPGAQAQAAEEGALVDAITSGEVAPIEASESAYAQLVGSFVGREGGAGNAATASAPVRDTDGGVDHEIAFTRDVEGPLHTLPALSSLFNTYVDSVLPPRDVDDTARAAAGGQSGTAGDGWAVAPLPADESDEDASENSSGSDAEDDGAATTRRGRATIDIEGRMLSRADADVLALQASLWGLSVGDDDDAEISRGDANTNAGSVFAEFAPAEEQSVDAAALQADLDAFDSGMRDEGLYEAIVRGEAPKLDGVLGEAAVGDDDAAGAGSDDSVDEKAPKTPKSTKGKSSKASGKSARKGKAARTANGTSTASKRRRRGK